MFNLIKTDMETILFFSLLGSIAAWFLMKQTKNPMYFFVTLLLINFSKIFIADVFNISTFFAVILAAIVAILGGELVFRAYKKIKESKVSKANG